MWSYLSQMSEERLAKISIYGAKEPIDYLQEQCPTLRIMNKDIMMNALLTYEAVGWMGYIPDEIKNTELHLPMKYAKLLWGWPDKFIERMETVNTRVILGQ